MIEEKHGNDHHDQVIEHDIELYEKKEKRLLRNIERIEEELEALAQRLIEKENAEKPKIQTGIRLDNQLSFRGRDTSKRYFDHLDEDKDGYLKYDDFRAMKAISTPNGIAHQSEYLSIQSWKMFLSDMGIKYDEYDRVNIDEFIKFRRIIEPDTPIEKELEKIGIGFLPYYLHIWKNLKEMINEVITHRRRIREQICRMVGPDEEHVEYQSISKLDDPLTLDEVSFILTNCGIIYSRVEYIRAMVDRATHGKIMEHLLRRFLFANLTNDEGEHNVILKTHEPGKNLKHQDTQIYVDDMIYITPKQLTAWFFGSPPNPTCSGIKRMFIDVKYKAYRWIRWIDESLKVFYQLGVNLRERKVYKDLHGPEKADQGTKKKSLFNFEFSLGKKEVSVEDGVGVNFLFEKIGGPEEYLQSQKLPRDAGFFIKVDLMIREEAKPEDVQKAAESLKLFLSNHFVDELKKSLQFRGIYCFPTVNTSDGAKVLRVAVCYKRVMSIDSFLKDIYFPFKSSEIFHELSGEIKTSIQLVDMLTSPGYNLDIMCAVEAKIRFLFLKEVSQVLFERAWLAFKAGLSKCEYTEPSTPEEEFTTKKLQYIRPYFLYVSEVCKKIYNSIRGFKSGQTSIKIKSLSELLGRLELLNPWFKRTFPKDFAKVDGMCNNYYSKWIKDLTNDLKNMYENLVEFSEKKILEEEAERRRVLMLGAASRQAIEEENSRKREILERMKKLGIDLDDEDIFAEEKSNPLDFYKSTDEEMRSRDINSYICYERLWNATIGIHSVEIASGNTSLRSIFQGLEIMEILPHPQGLEKWKEDFNYRRKNPKGSRPASPEQDILGAL